MRAFFFLMFLLLGLASCIHEYKYCNCGATDEQLRAYNDVINELVERRFYNFYLGKDEESVFKAYVEKPADTARLRAEIIELQNEIYGDTSRFCTLYLDTTLSPGFENLKYYETDTGEYSTQFTNIISLISNNKQAIIDSLNERQTKYSSANFSLYSSRIVSIRDAYKKSSNCIIGKISPIFIKLMLGNLPHLELHFLCCYLCQEIGVYFCGSILHIQKFVLFPRVSIWDPLSP